jgi:nicotinamidase-related amidase
MKNSVEGHLGSEISRRDLVKGLGAVGLCAVAASASAQSLASATVLAGNEAKVSAGSQEKAVGAWQMHGKPALVVNHMQASILDNKSEYNFGPLVRQSGMIERVRALLDAFRERNLPIVYLGAVMGDGGLQHRLPAYGKLFDMIRSNIDKLDDREAARTVIAELGRRPEEPVLTNWLLGGYTQSGLDTWLKVNHVDTVVMTGFATHSVVFNATIQACDNWYSVVIPRDAMTSFLPALSETMLNELFPFYSKVTTTADVIAHLS